MYACFSINFAFLCACNFKLDLISNTIDLVELCRSERFFKMLRSISVANQATEISIMLKLNRTFSLESRLSLYGVNYEFDEEQRSAIHRALNPDHEKRRGRTLNSRKHHLLITAWATNHGNSIVGFEDSLVSFQRGRRSTTLTGQYRGDIVDIYQGYYGAEVAEAWPAGINVRFCRRLCCFLSMA